MGRWLVSSRSSVLAVVGLLGLVLVVVASSWGAGGQSVRKRGAGRALADLRVVGADSDVAGSRLRVVATVVNKGGRRARDSRGAVAWRRGDRGEFVQLVRFSVPALKAAARRKVVVEVRLPSTAAGGLY